MKINLNKKLRKRITKFLIPFSSAVFALLLTQNILISIKPLQELELKYLDIRFSYKTIRNIKDSADVIILGISQDDYNQIPEPNNAWPWPRSYFAKVISHLNQAGVKAIGIDLLMSNDDKYSKENDLDFERAMREKHNVVVAGELNVRDEVLNENAQYRVDKNFNYRNKFYNVDNSVGIVQISSDEDGIYRRYKPFVISSANNKILPTFSFAILNKYFGLNNNPIAEVQKSFFLLGDKKIPKYDNSSMLINYYGPSGTFEYINFTDVLDGSDFQTKDELYYETELNIWNDLLSSGKFKDKIVLIGSVMAEDGDFHPVAFGPGKRKGDNQMWGVEIHANVLQNILWDDYLVKESESLEIILIFILAFLSFLAFSFFKENKNINLIVSESINVLLLIISFVSFYYLGILLFVENNFVLSIISPLLVLVISYFATTAYYAVNIRRSNALIKGMFGKYVSRSLVNQLLENPEELSLGGIKKHLTIMFSDIEGFTAISEKMQPEELVEFINNYLSVMTSIVLKHKGTLDKYLGDSLMAFWGAPIEIEEKELNACKAALMMQSRMKDIYSQSGIELRMRIGIHSDDVVVGNIGGVERFDYTVMGDGVNLASRLEGANKIYGTSIMISETTYEAVKNSVFVRMIDNLVVKGRTKPIVVYELLGLVDNKNDEDKFSRYGEFIKGIYEYHKMNFKVANKHFQKSVEVLNSDSLSRIYLERSAQYIKNPPPENWDGVYYLKSK